MVESGSNIRIVQNEFKADNLDIRYTFPSIDIQVGDGNLGDTDITSLNYLKPPITTYIQPPLSDLISGPVNEFDLDLGGYDKQVIVLTGRLTKTTAFYFPTTKESHWLLINNTNHSIRYGKRGDDIKMMPSVLPSSWGLITAYKKIIIEAGVRTERWGIRSFGSRPVSNCVIEDNLVRVLRNDVSSGGAYDVNYRKHTAVKVNSNAVGTDYTGMVS